MIDTVRLTCGTKPSAEQLAYYWEKNERTRGEEAGKVEYHYNPRGVAAEPFRATYRPKALQGHDQFLLEASLPKVVFGNNWTVLTDLQAAISRLDAILQACRAMPELMSVGEMSLSRLDACCQYPVGDLLPYYIEALAKLEYPHRTTVRFNDQTVEFRAKSVKCKFYDKHAETQGEAPPGLLRHEATFHKARTIKQALGTKKPVPLGTVTSDMIATILGTDLHRLGIHGCPFATVVRAAEHLVTTYGPNVGGYRFTLLQVLQTVTRAELAKRFGVSRSTVCRCLSDIRKAGIPLALSDAEEPLPPLEVAL